MKAFLLFAVALAAGLPLPAGEVVRPTYHHQGIVSIDLPGGAGERAGLHLHVIRTDEDFAAFQARLPRRGISKTNPAPENDDPLRRGNPYKLDSFTLVVLECDAIEPARLQGVEDSGDTLVVSASAPLELSARPIGTGGYQLLVFPRFVEAVKLKPVAVPAAKAFEAQREAARALSQATRSLPRTGVMPAVEMDPKVLATAREMALAPFPPRAAWQVLLASRTLHDGTSLAEATRLLGRPSNLYPGGDDKTGAVDWYVNPGGRHVAPCLGARLRPDGTLHDWKIRHR